MKFNVKADFADVQRQLGELQTGIGNKALSSALNKTTAQAKTTMSREIRAEFNVTAGKVNQALVVKKAVASGKRFSLEATLESPNQRGRSLNIINFGARQTAKGVSFKIKRNGPRKLIPGSFIANDGRTVFIRIGKQRLPIKAVQTIDVAGMFNTRRVNEKVVQLIKDKFPEIFANEAKFYTDRFNAKAKK